MATALPIVPVPTLSSAGWVRSASQKADFLLSHFYESDKFQTYIYGQNVTNLQWLIEQYGHDIIKVCQEIQRALELYLGRYYESVAINVVSDDDPAINAVPNETSSIKLRLYAQVTEKGKDYSFARLIMATNSKFASIVKLNNEGKLS